MPRYKISDTNRKKLIKVKTEYPNVRNSTLAMIFNLSQSRVGEIVREHEAEVKAATIAKLRKEIATQIVADMNSESLQKAEKAWAEEVMEKGL